MPRKTYYCPQCDTEFSGLISVHRACGKRGVPARRSNLEAMIAAGTPSYMGNQSVRRADKLMEREFAARGIGNFSNAGGGSKVTFTGSYGGGPIHGFQQPPITAGWGNEGLAQVNQQYGTNFSLPSVQPPQGPVEQSGQNMPWGQAVPKIPVE